MLPGVVIQRCTTRRDGHGPAGSLSRRRRRRDAARTNEAHTAEPAAGRTASGPARPRPGRSRLHLQSENGTGRVLTGQACCPCWWGCGASDALSQSRAGRGSHWGAPSTAGGRCLASGRGARRRSRWSPPVPPGGWASRSSAPINTALPRGSSVIAARSPMISASRHRPCPGPATHRAPHDRSASPCTVGHRLRPILAAFRPRTEQRGGDRHILVPEGAHGRRQRWRTMGWRWRSAAR